MWMLTCPMERVIPSAAAIYPSSGATRKRERGRGACQRRRRWTKACQVMSAPRRRGGVPGDQARDHQEPRLDHQVEQPHERPLRGREEHRPAPGGLRAAHHGQQRHGLRALRRRDLRRHRVWLDTPRCGSATPSSAGYAAAEQGASSPWSCARRRSAPPSTPAPGLLRPRGARPPAGGGRVVWEQPQETSPRSRWQMCGTGRGRPLPSATSRSSPTSAASSTPAWPATPRRASPTRRPSGSRTTRATSPSCASPRPTRCGTSGVSARPW